MSAPISTVRTCASCGQKNRVPARRLADTGTCGRCKAALPPPAEPIEADRALFDDVVAGSTVPVLVDFWAPWCGPCRMTGPEVDKTARATAGKAVVLKVNTDEQPELAARFGIQSIPTFMVFQQGAPVKRQAGAVRSDALLRMLAPA
jgi:thioredoxin 2